MCRAERIASELNNEKMLLCQNVDNAGYSSPFTNSVIIDFEHKQNKRQEQEDEYIIPPNLFEIVKEPILVVFSYWPQNELVAKRFLFHQIPSIHQSKF